MHGQPLLPSTRQFSVEMLVLTQNSPGLGLVHYFLATAPFCFPDYWNHSRKYPFSSLLPFIIPDSSQPKTPLFVPLGLLAIPKEHRNIIRYTSKSLQNDSWVCSCYWVSKNIFCSPYFAPDSNSLYVKFHNLQLVATMEHALTPW